LQANNVSDFLDSGAGLANGNDSGGAGTSAPAAVPAKRGPGRPKGTPNPNGRTPGSGRKKGTPNKATTLGREFIIKKSSALPFLCDVAAGRKVKIADPDNPKKKIEVYPAFADRLRAAQTLAPMIVPTLKSTELSGPGGKPMALTLVDFLRGLPE
jgi:hypothetical protein